MRTAAFKLNFYSRTASGIPLLSLFSGYRSCCITYQTKWHHHPQILIVRAFARTYEAMRLPPNLKFPRDIVKQFKMESSRTLGTRMEATVYIIG